MALNDPAIEQGENLSPSSSEPSDSNWEHISVIADRMVLAWDRAEMREEARNLAGWITEAQAAYVWRELWWQKSEKWRKWALSWLGSDECRKGDERYAKLGDGE